MVSLECATWELTNLLQFTTSVYCARWMSQRQGFGFPKLLTSDFFDEEKTSIINSVPKSTVYKNKWAIQIFRESVDIWILYPNL